MKKILFLIAFASAFASAQTVPLIYMSGGGGSVKPAATNAVLEAAYAYTDSSITNLLAYLDWDMGSSLSDGVNAITPNSPTNVVLASDLVLFSVSDQPSVKALPMFEVYAPADTPVFVASTEGSKGQTYSLVFTCSSVGVPIDFKLIITLMPYEGVEGTASKVIVFNLRRTF